jgi:hypothetical protein
MPRDEAFTFDERDLLIVQHVARHRLTTNEVLRRLVAPNAKLNAMVKVTSRLCRLQMLQKFPLAHPQTYFTLTSKACRQIGVATSRSLPLGPQSLPSEFATLLYCTYGERYHQRLMNHEIRERFPWFPAGHNHLICCRDLTEMQKPVMEWIRPDLGGPSHHIVRKTFRRLNVWVQSSAFNAALQQSHLRLVFLTATAQKAQCIQEAIQLHEWPQNTPIHLAVIPELLQIAGRKPYVS